MLAADGAGNRLVLGDSTAGSVVSYCIMQTNYSGYYLYNMNCL